MITNCALALALPSPGCDSAGRRGPFTAGELREDFRQLRRAMESLHPRLYAFTPKAEFDQFLDQQYGAIDRDMSLEAFYAVVMSSLAKIGCSHARLMAPEGYWDRCPGRMFPLELAFLKDGTYALAGYDDSTAVPPGSEIVSINGVPAAEIVGVLKRRIPSDGHREPWKRHRLNVTFPYLYALFYGYPDMFAVYFIPPGGGQPKEADLPPAGLEDLRRFPRRHHPAGDPEDGDLGFEVLEGRNAAVLTIRTFAYYDERNAFFGFVEDSFRRIRASGVENLILDLRGNDGGDPYCTTRLLAHIEPRPVPYFARAYLQYGELARPIPLADHHFRGNLYILIDGGCSSSTGHLCAVLDYHDVGVFVGEETGATYTCNDAGKSITLENTKLQIHTPRMTFEAAVSGLPPDRGIRPDYEAGPSNGDLISGRDPAMVSTLGLIK